MKKSIFISICMAISLNASDTTLFLENDVINGEDEHYTNGFSIAYLSNDNTNDTEIYNNSFNKFVNILPNINNYEKQSLGMVFNHYTFMPSSVNDKGLKTNDLPYAGVILFDFALNRYDDNILNQYMLSLGFVGKHTYAEELQKAYHDITGNGEPQGWENQLNTNALSNFSYTFANKSYKNDNFDWTNSLRIDAGNFQRSSLLLHR